MRAVKMIGIGVTIVAGLQLTLGCAGKSGINTPIVEGRVASSYDRTWQRLNEFLIVHKIPPDVAEKENGLIRLDTAEIGHEVARDWLACNQLSNPASARCYVQYKIQIGPVDSKTETNLLIRVSFKCYIYDRSGYWSDPPSRKVPRYQWRVFDCESNGVFEKAILDYVE